MGKITKSIEIEASPEKVFAFLLDVEKMNKLHGGFVERKRTSNGPFGVGSTMHNVVKGGGQRVEMDLEVTEFVMNRKLTERTIGNSKLKMEHTYNLEPTAKVTKVTASMDYSLPYSVLGKLIDKLRVGKNLEKDVIDALEKMKKTLEA